MFLQFSRCFARLKTLGRRFNHQITKDNRIDQTVDVNHSLSGQPAVDFVRKASADDRKDLDEMNVVWSTLRSHRFDFEVKKSVSYRLDRHLCEILTRFCGSKRSQCNTSSQKTWYVKSIP